MSNVEIVTSVKVTHSAVTTCQNLNDTSASSVLIVLYVVIVFQGYGPGQTLVLGSDATSG